MISGPTIPRTPDGVRDLIRRHLGLAEHGLELVCEDLELGSVEVDAFGHDAVGAPVLVFGAVPGNARALPVRVLNARSWFQSHGHFLVGKFVDRGVRPTLPVRLLVLGLDFLADTVRELESLDMANLAVHQFCSFTVGGQMHVGVTQLVGSESSHTRVSGAGVVDPAAMFHAPSGAPEGPVARCCARFLDMARRLDPRITASGDRFSRRLAIAGVPLADLSVTDSTVRVSIAGGDEVALDSVEDCPAVVDRLVRRLLTGLAEPVREAIPPAGAATPTGNEGLDEGRFSLEPIRQAVASARVSQDEYSALEGEEP